MKRSQGQILKYKSKQKKKYYRRGKQFLLNKCFTLLCVSLHQDTASQTLVLRGKAILRNAKAYLALGACTSAIVLRCMSCALFLKSYLSHRIFPSLGVQKGSTDHLHPSDHKLRWESGNWEPETSSAAFTCANRFRKCTGVCSSNSSE